jgi:chemotaxis signal transduction protein
MAIDLTNRLLEDRHGVLDLSEGLWALEAATPDATERCLLFECGGHPFAAPISMLRDVLTHTATTRVPGVPSWVLGLTNVRGTVVGVVDLARFLGLAEREARASRTLICGAGPRLVGLAVADARRLVDYTADELSSAVGLTGRTGQYVQSLVPVDGGLVPLLDVKRLLEDDELTGR